MNYTYEDLEKEEVENDSRKSSCWNIRRKLLHFN